jgi:uncharacterized membrane protein YkgB
MVCPISCFIAFIFIAGSIYLTLAVDKRKEYTDFMSQISPSNQERFRQIAQERQTIYFQGLGLGFIISLAFIAATKYTKIGVSVGKYATLCTVAAITLVTNYFYYMITPKSDYMLSHLESKRENTAWLNMYKTMQQNYHIGLLLGLLAVVAFGNAICA